MAFENVARDRFRCSQRRDFWALVRPEMGFYGLKMSYFRNVGMDGEGSNLISIYVYILNFFKFNSRIIPNHPQKEKKAIFGVLSSGFVSWRWQPCVRLGVCLSLHRSGSVMPLHLVRL